MTRAKPNRPKECPYVGKGGLKLAFALQHFNCQVTDQICADFGSHQGGFVDCLLQHGAAQVHTVDTCYGVLDWKLRQNPQVIVHERCNALHWHTPQPLSLITIDVGWTRQKYIIPAAIDNIAAKGTILSLLKPQYECDKKILHKGVVPEDELPSIIEKTSMYFQELFTEVAWNMSPYKGSGGNTEIWYCLR